MQFRIEVNNYFYNAFIEAEKKLIIFLLILKTV